MKEITEDYVSFETRNLLMKKGMQKDCFNHLVRENTQENAVRTYYTCSLYKAMKWLREVHHLHITVFSSSQESWMYRITKPHQKLEEGCYGEDYTSNEDACESAIKYCLENLI